MDFYTYMLRCSDGSYYVGHTDDIDARFAQHQSGAVAGYTQKRRPVALVWCERFPDRDQAFTAERRIKNWPRAKKEALIQSDWEALREAARKPAFRSGASLDTGSRQARPPTRDERERDCPPTPVRSSRVAIELVEMAYRGTRTVT